GFKGAKLMRSGGIGSAVYASLAFTPMHDLMVTISLAFFGVAMLALLRALYLSHTIGFFVSGVACFAILAVSAIIYYSNQFVVALPWAQRLSFVLNAVWLLSLEL